MSDKETFDLTGANPVSKEEDIPIANKEFGAGAYGGMAGASDLAEGWSDIVGVQWRSTVFPFLQGGEQLAKQDKVFTSAKHLLKARADNVEIYLLHLFSQDGLREVTLRDLERRGVNKDAAGQALGNLMEKGFLVKSKNKYVLVE